MTDVLDEVDTFGDFKKWSSTPRWHRGLSVTEKIDGTNGCIVIYNGEVKAQKRTGFCTPDNDNFGFARWVYDNAGALTDTLGYGYHYGEWFGEGIQKNPLGIEGKRFALFHWTKYTEKNGYDLEQVDGLERVPLLHHGQATVWTLPNILSDLAFNGSKVVGAKDGAEAEGIIVFHKETQEKYKILLTNDDVHKWELQANNAEVVSELALSG